MGASWATIERLALKKVGAKSGKIRRINKEVGFTSGAIRVDGVPFDEPYRLFTVTDEEADAEEARYERVTGKCANCEGKGYFTSFRCSKCKGLGCSNIT